MATYNIKHDDTVDAILSDIIICPAVDLKANSHIPVYYKTNDALWDTGATNTLISKKVVTALNLQSLNNAVISSANGEIETTTYLVHIILPTGTAELNVEAILNDNPDYHVVIGMDVINRCDFAFSNKGGKSCFSLRHPSSEDIVLQ